MDANIHQVKIPFSKIEFSFEKIRAEQQLYQHGQYFSGIMEGCYSEIREKCTINAGCQTLRISKVEENELHLNDLAFKVNSNIVSHFRKAEKAMVFMLTLGNEFDEYNKSVLANDALNGLICDAIGSEIIEKAADYFISEFQATVGAEGLKTTNRFSPGYCMWDIREQHKLFSLFPHRFLGITLNQSALMKPMKSITGLVGIGKHVKYLDYNCKECNQKNCHKWKTGY